MRAGTLRHRLRLERPAPIVRRPGGTTAPAADEWEPMEHVHAAIRALAGGEALRGMQMEARVTHEITIRYRPGVSATQRAVLESGEGDRIFHFRRVVDPDERRQELRIMAEEVRA